MKNIKNNLLSALILALTFLLAIVSFSACSKKDLTTSASSSSLIDSIPCEHEVGEWITVEKVSCEEETYKYLPCLKCNEALDKIVLIQKQEHSFDEEVSNRCLNCPEIDPKSVEFMPIKGSGFLSSYIESYILTHFFGKGKEAVIPSHYEGKPVTQIGAYAFRREAIEKVILPDTIEEIGQSAFSSLYALNEIVIPDSVISIGESAFSNCEKLETAVLSKNIKKLATYTFANCENLKEIIIPNGVKAIEKHAFLSCKSLKTVKIPKSVEIIEEYAFEKCTGIVIVTELDETPVGWDKNCFFNAKTVILNFADFYKDEQGVFYALKKDDTAAALQTEPCENLVIPETIQGCLVTEISNSAFTLTADLTTISLPNSLTKINENSLEYCRNLKTINYDGTIDEWTKLEKGGFWDANTGEYVVCCLNGKIAKDGTIIEAESNGFIFTLSHGKDYYTLKNIRVKKKT